MLRISKIQAPKNARGSDAKAVAARAATAKYYTKYYAGTSMGITPDGAGGVNPDDAPRTAGHGGATWLGQQAQAMGLTGAVSPEQLERMFAWQDPRDGTPLGRQRDDSIWAFDATFSAPKSVSVMWALAEDTATQEAIVAAHVAAVAAAVAFLEPEVARLRRGSATKGTLHQVRAQSGLLAAVAAHETARPVDGQAPDPQLHSHVVLSAVLPAEADGRWTALDAGQLFNFARVGGGAYQAALRAELVSKLGVAFDPTEQGIGEITGVPLALRDTFSNRSKELLAAALDPSDAGSRAHAATTTRSGKEHADGSALRPTWIASAEAAGVSPTVLAEAIAAAGDPARTRRALEASLSLILHDEGTTAADILTASVAGLVTLEEVLIEAQESWGVTSKADLAAITAILKAADPTSARRALEADPGAVLRRPAWTVRDLMFSGLSAGVSPEDAQAWAEHILAGAVRWDDLPRDDLPALRAVLAGVKVVEVRPANAEAFEKAVTALKATLQEGQEPSAEEIATIRAEIATRPIPAWQAAVYASSETVLAEAEVLAIAREGVCAGEPADAHAIEDAVEAFRQKLRAKNHEASLDQIDAIYSLAGGGHRIAVLVGHAGASKTTTIAAVANALGRSGVLVRGTAVAAKAVHGLEAATGIPSQTVASLLAAVDRGEALEPGLVLVVDEAGMLATADLARLTTAVQAVNGRLILVGDPKQLAAVGPGGLLGEIATQLPTVVATLTTTHRQQVDWQKELAANWRRGLGVDAVSALVAHGRLAVSADHDLTLQNLVAAYRAALVEGRAANPDAPDAQLATMLAPRRADAQALARLARKAAREAGELAGEDVWIDEDLSLAAGDQVVLRAAFSQAQDVAVGTRGTVTRVTRQGVDVVLADGRIGRVANSDLHRGGLRATATIDTIKARLTLRPTIQQDAPELWAAGSLVVTTGVVRGARGGDVGEAVRTAMATAGQAARAAGKSKRAGELAVAKAADRAAAQAGRVSRGTAGTVIARAGGTAIVRGATSLPQEIPTAELRAWREANPDGEVISQTGGHAVVRDERGRVFEVADAALTGKHSTLSVGTTIQTTRPMKIRRRLTNGETATVEAIGEEGARLRMADGSPVTIPLDKLAETSASGQRTVELASASTVHLAQGATVGACFVLADGLSSTEGAYVALSRQTHELMVAATAESVAAAAIDLAGITGETDAAAVSAHARARGEGEHERMSPQAIAAAWLAAEIDTPEGAGREAVGAVAAEAAARVDHHTPAKGIAVSPAPAARVGVRV